MEFSDLVLVRQLQVFQRSCPGEPCQILDLEVPFEVKEGEFGLGLANLQAMADCCRVALTQEQQTFGKEFGDFKVLGVYPYRLLPPEVAAHADKIAARVAGMVVNYVRGWALDLNLVDNEYAFELGADLPTQGVIIRSWLEFRLEGTNDDTGTIKLHMDYPEILGPSQRKPIEDIKAFLSSVWAFCLGSRQSHVREIDEILKLRREEDRHVHEYDRTIVVNSPSLYRPIGAGYSFPHAELKLIADNPNNWLPVDTDVSTFLEEFLRRVAYRVPQLCL